MMTSAAVCKSEIIPGNFLPTKLSVSLLIEHDGKLMMVEEAMDRYRGKWSQPQGMIEPHETPEQAAVREAKEETGLSVRILSHFGTYLCPGDPYMINFCFRARAITLEQAPLHSDVLSARWHSLSELVRLDEKGLLRSPLTLQRIKDWSMNKSLSVGFVEIPPLG